MRNLFAECVSVVNMEKDLVTKASEIDANALLSFNGNKEEMTIPNTVMEDKPSFVTAKQFLRIISKPVYYISDLHISHHVFKALSNSASDQEVIAYIQIIVDSLFDDSFKNEIKSFDETIVLFGGDVDASFSITSIFYHCFVNTWKRIKKEQYDTFFSVLHSIVVESEECEETINNWIAKHEWAKNPKRPLLENKRVPLKVKNAILRKMELAEKKEDIEKNGVSYNRLLKYHNGASNDYIYAVLGNHEYWGFETYNQCIDEYSKLFSELDIRFLNSNIQSLGVHYVPKKREYDIKQKGFIHREFKRSEDPETYDKYMLTLSNLIIVGGTGFADRNQNYNAKNGLYSGTINEEEEIHLASMWRSKYKKATDIAKQHRCNLVVLTHNPIDDWMDSNDIPENTFFFWGHTHRNIAYGEKNNVFFIANNQIGYTKKRFELKKINLYLNKNPFASDSDGFRIITADEYQEFYRYIHETIPGTGTIKRRIDEDNASLYMLKKHEYYCFLLKSLKGIYICNGGTIKKVGASTDLTYYFERFDAMLDMYIEVLSPLRSFQEKLSEEIKRVGGDGKIHGTIVDIDFFNHIMINTEDGSLIYYYSPSFGYVKEYPDFISLVQANCPVIEERMMKCGSQLLAVSSARNHPIVEMHKIDPKYSPYSVSRRINALQRLFTKKVLRDWNNEVLEKYREEQNQSMIENNGNA